MSRSFQKSHANILGAILIFVVFLLCAFRVNAQFGSSGIDDDPRSGMRNGNNTIIGRLLFPAGTEVSRRYTVRLSAVAIGEFSAMTDNNGVFTFRRLKEGTYYISIDAGKDYLPGSDTVEFYDNRGRTATVEIQLRPKPTITKAGVINAATAGVPKAALEMYNKARDSAIANDPRKAIEQLRAAVTIYPKFVLALNEMSILYVSLGEPEKAVEVLAEAIKVQSENATLRLNRGYLLMQLRKFDESEVELHRAIELEGTSALAHLYRGWVLVKLLKFDPAEKELKRVIALGGPHVAMAYRFLGGLYNESGDTTREIEALEKYLAMSPTAKDADEVRGILKQLKESKEKSKGIPATTP